MFIPKRCLVGYQERNDTYTGKLGYIIYFDEKNVLRKEKSWEGWRDKKLDSLEFENVPTEGFVLNKKAGGRTGGWNDRQTYTRVYDPRGFEFEINIENLLYLLDHSSCIKGKGLEGSFVYGWKGTELVLIPVSDPKYKEIEEEVNNRFSPVKLKSKDLIVGNTYLLKKGGKYIFLGKEKDNSKTVYKFVQEHKLRIEYNRTASSFIKDLGDYNKTDLWKYEIPFLKNYKDKEKKVNIDLETSIKLYSYFKDYHYITQEIAASEEEFEKYNLRCTFSKFFELIAEYFGVCETDLSVEQLTEYNEKFKPFYKTSEKSKTGIPIEVYLYKYHDKDFPNRNSDYPFSLWSYGNRIERQVEKQFGWR